MATITLPRRPTDAELEDMARLRSATLERCVHNLAELRDSAQRADACDDGSPEAADARALRLDIDQARDRLLSIQAEAAGELGAIQVEIAYRRLRGEWHGGNHAAH